MRDIIFISLPRPHLKDPSSQAGLGLPMMAAMLDQYKISTAIHDCSLLSNEDAIEKLEEAKGYGISAVSLELPSANRFAKKIKEKYPESKVILGGPGTYTDEYVDWKYVDSICKGEADVTILKIHDELIKEKLQKLYIGNPPPNLDVLPLPARHYLPHLGGRVFTGIEETATTLIATSRGCPFRCAFCADPYVGHYTVRYRNPQNIYDEMVHVIETYGIRHFRFSDDLFTAKRSHAIAVSNLIKDLGVTWRASIRTKPLDLELLKIMKTGGMQEICLGVESFDDNVLKILNKKTLVKDNVRAIKLAHEVDLDVRILLMSGTPGQTEETLELNRKYIQAFCDGVSIACTRFVPMPGSPIWDDPDKYNIEILSRDLDDYNFYSWGTDGLRKPKPLIKIKDRPLDKFQGETTEFLTWLDKREGAHKG